MKIVDRQIEVLSLARDCIALGARHHTLKTVTGLSDAVLTEVFRDQMQWKRQGRTACSSEAYLNYSVTHRLAGSLFANLFDEMYTDPARPGQALVSAYRLYLHYCGLSPRLMFDAAHTLASDLRGLWQCKTPRLALAYCGQCHLASLTAAGTNFITNCPYCNFIERYRYDRRVRDQFPTGTSNMSRFMTWRGPVAG